MKGLQVLLQFAAMERTELSFTCIYQLLHFTWQVYYDSFYIMTSIPPFNCTCPLFLHILSLTITDLFGQAELVGIWASVFRMKYCTILEWLKLPGSLHYHPSKSLKLTIHWHCFRSPPNIG